jgi:hypothetical protein
MNFIFLFFRSTNSKMLNIQLEPLPHLQIVDHYSRRNPSSTLAIGALLGTSSTKSSDVTIKNTFPVPTTLDDGQLGLNIEDFCQSMALYRRSYPKERIVGWYLTSILNRI